MKVPFLISWGLCYFTFYRNVFIIQKFDSHEAYQEKYKMTLQVYTSNYSVDLHTIFKLTKIEKLKSTNKDKLLRLFVSNTVVTCVKVYCKYVNRLQKYISKLGIEGINVF